MHWFLVVLFVSAAGCSQIQVRPSDSTQSASNESNYLPQDSIWSIRGSVVDRETEEPLIGANVIVLYRIDSSGTLHKRGATTNLDGKYIVWIKSAPRPLLECITGHYIGYSDLENVTSRFHDGNSLLFVDMALNSNPFMHHHDFILFRRMFDKRQTNFKVVVYQDDILNLPIAK